MNTDKIIKNDLFSVSPNKVIRDRSFISCIFRAVEITETQVWATEESGEYRHLKGSVSCLIKHEHDFHRISEETLANIKAAEKVA